MQETLGQHLERFAQIADAWLARTLFMRRYHDFFRDFVDRDKLASADWPYFQRLGGHIHAFQSMSLARASALGRPNHPIERYREAFLDLAHGPDDAETRIRRFTDPKTKLKRFGDSAMSEIIGQILPDDFMLYNARDEWALGFLGIDVPHQRGDKFADRYLRYNAAVAPVIEAYETIVGRRTDLPVRLEVDQFFSWLYEHRQELTASTPEPLVPDDTTLRWPSEEPAHVWMIAAGEGSASWPAWQKDGVIAVRFDGLGDLSRFATREDAEAAWWASIGGDARPRNDSLCIYEFVHVMQPGDVVFVRRGRSEIVGYGVITSDFRYEPGREGQCNVRGAKWLAAGAWKVRDKPFVTKTLLEIGKYPTFVDDIRKGIGIDGKALDVADEGARRIVDGGGFGLEDALEDLFVAEEHLRDWLDLIAERKNIVLQGPPGIGKTFVAQRLAWLLLGERDDNRVRIVQFHPSYGYEDFVQGYRASGEGFERRDGFFLRICAEARAQPEQQFVLIIDEINRGNLARVFGELLMLLEADKRKPVCAVVLAYSNAREARFYIPENVYLIGTMNTADRSLAVIDHALRRRFAFVSLQPAFATEAFDTYLNLRIGLPPRWRTLLCERMQALNAKISKDPALGADLVIGHSPFCRPLPSGGDIELWYRRIVETEIVPLLREYWYDQPKRVQEAVGALLADVGDDA